MEKKVTKTEMFETIKSLLADNADVVAFCDNEIAHIAAKAEKAKARAAEKKAIGDELYAAVIAAVGTELVSCEDVLDSIEGEDLTVAKIRARLSQGVKNNVLIKETVKTEDGKAKVKYRAAE